MSYFDPGNGEFIMIDGHMVERKAHAIALKIWEYDEDLQLICLDPDNENVSFTEAPFMVIRDKGDGVFERVLEAWELDDRILERLWLSDGRKNDQMDILAKMELAKKKEADDAWNEKKWADHEIFAAAMANPKSSFSFKNENGEHITIKDDEGVIRDKGKQSF